MIAKRITSKAPTSRSARLVKYIVDAEGSLDPRSWTRTADYMLASKTNKYGEKVGGVRVTNCHTDDPAAATTLIEATQACNTTSKTDKTYHLVFSFPPGEEPDIKTLNKIEDELVASIGFADHQRISAVHIDKQHLHVHVAINKVHPTGFQNIEPYFDKVKLMTACERLEIELGLTRVNHGLTGQKTKKEKEQQRLKDKPAQMEAQSGIESLVGFVSRDVAPAMREAKDWQDMHSILAKHGLQIKKRGAGLVIGSDKIWAKASQIDRSFSLKSLTDKHGEFQPAKAKVKEPYHPKPTQKHPSSDVLYARYQHERDVAQHTRKQALDKLWYDSLMQDREVKKWHIAQRLFIKASGSGGPKRRAMLKGLSLNTLAIRARNRSVANKRRKEIIASTSMPTWAQWLVNQAETGNTEALDVLRSRKHKEWMRGNYLTVQHPETIASIVTTSIVSPDPRLHATKNGTIFYKTADGGMVFDRVWHIQAFRTTSESTIMALELAAKRYRGQTLIVEGQDSFKAEIAKLAKERGIKVRIAQTKHKEKGIEI